MARRITLLLALLCAIIFTGLGISLLQFGAFYVRHPIYSFIACWGVLLFSPLAVVLAAAPSREASAMARWARRPGMLTVLLALVWGPLAYWMTGNTLIGFKSGLWFHSIVMSAFAILILSLLTMVLYVVGLRGRQARPHGDTR